MPHKDTRILIRICYHYNWTYYTPARMYLF